MIFIGKYLLFFRGQYLFKNKPPDGNAPPNSFYRALYPKIIQDIEVRIYIFRYLPNTRESSTFFSNSIVTANPLGFIVWVKNQFLYK